MRDSAADAQEAVEFRDLLIRSSLATIPLVGVVFFVVKLEILVKGDTNLALAIVENMAVSTIAFLLLFSILPYLATGVAAGSARVHYNREFSASVRRTSGWVCWISVIVLAFAQPWWLLAIALIYIITEKLTGGAEPGRTQTFDQWLQGPAPEDAELRKYWTALRVLARDAGTTVAAQAGEIKIAEPVAHTKTDVTAFATKRFALINAPRRKTPMSAITVALVLIFASFGITILTGPMKVAATEHVQFTDGTSANGYLFANMQQQVLFVSSDMTSTRYAAPTEIGSRSLCVIGDTFLQRTVFQLFIPDRGAPCPDAKTAARSVKTPAY